MPDVGLLLFPQIPVEGKFIDSHKHGLLDGLGMPVCSLSTMEKLSTDAVPCSMNMLVNGRGIPKVLLTSVPKSPS